jgi:hypothetical protein
MKMCGQGMSNICRIIILFTTMKTKLLFSIFLMLSILGEAQTELYTAIRGTVVDKQSQFPIPGVQVIVISSNPVRAGVSDENGNFRVEQVPVGRQSIEVKMMGFEPMSFANVLLYSNRDLELNVQLMESITTTGTVEIVAQENKSETINKMSSVSTRTISMEEARRFSGTLQDPARMAQNFAGVSNASDSRNDIVIRGNSPTGVLWRMEGIDIPSPNHFATLGTTGGPVSMLNANNLASSDFSTSAFAAEYGNALAGVFDLRLRSGNKDKREFMGQVGFNGFEFGAEGPFKKGKQASYMLNYRYSLLGALQNMGVSFGTGAAVPQYQDLTFKIDVPTAKAGRFALWGVGGTSFIDFKAAESDASDLYNGDRQNSQWTNTTAVAGASHTYFFNEKTYGKLTLAWSTAAGTGYIDSLDVARNTHRTFGQDRTQEKASAHYFINSKLNSRNSIRAGVIADKYYVHSVDSVLYQSAFYFRQSDQTGTVGLAQAYAQWQYRPTNRLTVNTGIHSQYFSHNNKSAVEPRLGMRYATKENQSLNVGLGLHSQLQPITVYFNRQRLSDGTVLSENKNLGFNRAAHAVVGYDIQFSQQVRLKTEVYYQHLFDVAVDRVASSFSMLNTGADFQLPNNGDLVNNGVGRNMGVELTLERFLDKGFYYLFTTSIFDSKYKGSDGVWRNTAFNGNYVFNLLGGKEWRVGSNNAITLDGKVTYAGGAWHAPIDLDASMASGFEVRKLDQNFSEQYSAYFRTDVKIGFRMNAKKYSQAISLDIRNVTNHKNVFMERYNNTTQEIVTSYQIGLFPMVLYNIWF